MTSAETALGAIWGLAGVTFVFVLLRLYTRVISLQSYGMDDYFYNAAFVLFITFSIMMTLAAQYGFGKDIETITSRDDLSRAILYQAIGQTLMVTGTAVSKASLGLFLMRLVVNKKHKIALAAPSIIFFMFVAAALLVFWFSCRPIAFLWDRMIPGGKAVLDPNPIGMAAGIWSVILDFWYAGFPWYIIWKLHMPTRDKLVIGGSMSLGVLAGACGIKRALELHFISDPNYTKKTVDLMIWHAAELTLTMVCIGIPVCRPAYQPFLYKLGLSSQRNASGTRAYERNTFGMRTIGGTEYPGQANNSHTGGESVGPYASRHGRERAIPSNSSDELILGPGYKSTAEVRSEHAHTGESKGVWVETETEVKSTRG